MHHVPDLESEEVCEGFGRVKTYVQLMGEAVERSRDALYEMPPAALASRTRRYLAWDFLGQPRALFEQMRHPVVEVAWPRRAGFALAFMLWLPLSSLYYLFVVPRRLLSRQARRAQPRRLEEAPSRG